VAQINAIKSQLRQVAQAFEFRPKLAEMMAQVPAPVRAETERRIAELESIDTEQLRAEANKKLRRLASQYANEPLDYYGTAGHAAKSLSHAINNVVVGQAAPEIAATDINGKPFRLSDQKGKVVLLWFTQDLFDNYAEFYEPMRGLASTYSDKPLQIVGIMSNHKQEHLKAAAKRGDLPWTVIPQTLNGPVQRDWGCDAYPTLYLVDHEGILHGSLGMAYGTDDADTTQIESQIDELLSKVSPAK
jgi:hypothetical protein